MNDTPLVTAKERELIQSQNRGRLVEAGKWRNFCCKCGIPLTVSREWLAQKTDLTCDDCRPAMETGGQLATAFSSDKNKKGF